MIVILKKYEPSFFQKLRNLLEQLEPWKTDRMDISYYNSVFDEGELSTIYVASRNEELVGTVVWQSFDRYPYGGYIRILAVAENCQRRGIGTLLLQKAEEKIFACLKNAYISVHEGNSQALDFYKKHGYHVVGPLHDYIHKGQTMLMLRKTTGPVW